MDDTQTILATLVVLVAASVSILGYSNEIEEHLNNEEAALVDEKPLPSKEEVSKVTPNKFVVATADSDAQTVDTAAESSGDEQERRPTIKTSNKKNKSPSTKAGKRPVRAARVKESLRNPNKKTQWFWRPNKKSKAATTATVSTGIQENMGYEI